MSETVHNPLTQAKENAPTFLLYPRRLMSTEKSSKLPVSAPETAPGSAKPLGKAKENAQTLGYGTVIVAGVCITALVLYTVFSELFSSHSPVRMFQTASDRCVGDPRVQDLLGAPVKAFGEETRRGRRRHVAHLDYVDHEGRKGVRVKFYLQGIRKRATAQLDAREVKK